MRAMNRVAVLLCLSLLLVPFAVSQQPASSGAVQSPSQFLKMEVGADRVLADYKQITGYFNALAQASPRVDVESLGKTTLGNDMIMAVISAEANVANKAKLKEISRQLNDPRGLTGEQVESLVSEGKTILLITCNIHSTEIGASQMALEWAHDLATTTDPKKLKWLSDVVVLLVPSLNPDGQLMIVDWYRKNLGTRYEGGPLPWLYHHYVGHDNNRDWYMLTQKETRAMNRAVYHEWFPNIWLDEHQMGSTGPRIFMPPYADPIAVSLDPLLFRGVNMIGTNMALRLEQKDKAGAIYGYVFDAYWPGGTRNTAWWKNVFGLLTEVASARIATPISVAPSELTGGGKGLIEYGKQINFPNPWRGGLWRMRDVMDYELIISDAALETASLYREDFLRGVSQLAREAVAEGKPELFWRISLDQRDPVAAARLAHLMREHGVDVLVEANKGYLIPTSQPYSRFVEEMFSTQRYPEVKPVPGPNILPPYDVAAWSLPLLMGVKVEKVTLPGGANNLPALKEGQGWPKGEAAGNGTRWLLNPDSNASVALVNEALKSGATVAVAARPQSAGGRNFAAGSYVIEGSGAAALAEKHHLRLTGVQSVQGPTAPLRGARVGLYKPWVASMDEGWTRFILEQYGFNLASIENKTMKAGNLRATFDVIVLPDVSKDLIIDGRGRREEGSIRYAEEFPPEYMGGIGREGVAALKQFVQDGGTLVALASSTDLLMDEFNIPVRNTLARVTQEQFLLPGSLLRMHVDTSHPLGYGLPNEVAAFVDEPRAFQTVLTGPEVERAVVGWYPEHEDQVLLSGWIRGADRLERRAAVVGIRQGKGKLALIGIRPQHRAQTEGTYRLLFNAIQWGAMEAHVQ